MIMSLLLSSMTASNAYYNLLYSFVASLSFFDFCDVKWWQQAIVIVSASIFNGCVVFVSSYGRTRDRWVWKAACRPLLPANVFFATTKSLGLGTAPLTRIDPRHKRCSNIETHDYSYCCTNWQKLTDKATRSNKGKGYRS